MDQQQFIESKRKENAVEKLHLLFKDVYENNAEATFQMNGETVKLSHKAAHLGLMLLNGFPAYHSDSYWYHNTNLTYGSKRHQAFVDTFGMKLWDEETKPLLWLTLGEEIAPLVLKAWANLREFMYQAGLQRRSFRMPKNESDNYCRQINFLIDLLNYLPEYDLTLLERLEHDNVLGYHNRHLSMILVALDDEKWDTLLLDVVYNRHPTIKVNTNIIKALLRSEKPENWKAIGDLLLAAQLQEGLRQSILENADEGSLGAFKYIIDLIIEHKIIRFSSAIRAVQTWIGMGYFVDRSATVSRYLGLGQQFLNAPETIEEAIKSKDNAVLFMALWAQGVFDVEKCKPLLHQIWEQGTLTKKCLVLMFIRSTEVAKFNFEFGQLALAEDNLQILGLGVNLLREEWSNFEDKETTFKRLETVLPLFPKEEKYFGKKIISWTGSIVQKSMVFNAMLELMKEFKPEQVRLLLPYFADFEVYQRERLTEGVLNDYYPRWYNRKKDEEKPKLTDFQKEFALIAIKNRAENVRKAGIEALKYATLKVEELQIFEKMLTRKSAALRESVIDLLQRDSTTILGSVERLINSRNAEQRLAALDIIIQLQKKNQFVNETMTLAETLENKGKFTNREEILLQTILHTKKEYTLENGFGLYNPKDKTIYKKPTIPQEGEFFERRQDLYKKGIINKIISKPSKFGLSKSIEKIKEDLEKLKALFLENKDYEYSKTYSDGEKVTVLLGNDVSYTKREDDKNPMEKRARFETFPLYQVWEKWFQDAKWTTFDLFTIFLVEGDSYDALEEEYFVKTMANLDGFLPTITLPEIETKRSYFKPLRDIIRALVRAFPYEKEKTYRVQAMSYALANVDESEQQKIVEHKEEYYTRSVIFLNCVPFQQLRYKTGHLLNDEDFKAFYIQKKWLYQEIGNFKNHRDNDYVNMYLSDDVRAYKFGLITKSELIHTMMRPDDIRELTRIKKDKDSYILKYPILQELLVPIRDRILDIELNRGDKATEVTLLAQNIYQLSGQNYFFRIAKALGNSTLNSGYTYGSREFSKKELLSTLLKRCLTVKTETQAAFKEAATKLNLKEKRWVELAMYSQQWSENIRLFLSWKNMESAVWWLHAHANSRHNEETESEISRFSAMPIEDFANGGVDVDWFWLAYKGVGKNRWKMLYDAAKYISDGTGHTKAKLYADVLLAKKKIREITARIKDKRNQDYLRVYGLVPLSRKTPQKDLLNRYLFIQQFLKESKQFGAQRRSSESLAAQISMDNLARTAGFQDPTRLTWAMEAKQAQVILAESEMVEFDGGVTVEMLVSKEGKPSLSVERNGNLLKSIPAKLRKEKSIVKLKGYVKQLKSQYVRSKKSLEEAMIRQDVFLWSEISMLSKHPVINPILEFLVFKNGDNLGFVCADGLKSTDGTIVNLSSKDKLILVHSVHLYQAKVWENYQSYVFENKIKQPFKQIFRELYLPTEDELHKRTISKRYAGHQVQPQKTVALLNSRGWRIDYRDGLQKVYHKEGVIAKIYAMADWFSPADIEAPTLETVEFFDNNNYKPIPFTELPPVIFSEVMRDLDLVVSVAHVGDVDPETSQSSVEMRGVLVKETARLFKLKNVEVSGKHVHIKGQMAEYSVHLGSAVVFQKPGRQLGIIPIHSQHRGRIFLPFSDDDPKSAELLSKVLLFAKDNEIQDPTILRQLNLHK